MTSFGGIYARQYSEMKKKLFLSLFIWLKDTLDFSGTVFLNYRSLSHYP